jgi:hypothetical protein
VTSGVAIGPKGPILLPASYNGRGRGHRRLRFRLGRLPCIRKALNTREGKHGKVKAKQISTHEFPLKNVDRPVLIFRVAFFRVFRAFRG